MGVLPSIECDLDYPTSKAINYQFDENTGTNTRIKVLARKIFHYYLFRTVFCLFDLYSNTYIKPSILWKPCSVTYYYFLPSQLDENRCILRRSRIQTLSACTGRCYGNHILGQKIRITDLKLCPSMSCALKWPFNNHKILYKYKRFNGQLNWKETHFVLIWL